MRTHGYLCIMKSERKHWLAKSILQFTVKALASYLTTSRHACVQLHTMQRPSFVFKVGGGSLYSSGWPCTCVPPTSGSSAVTLRWQACTTMPRYKQSSTHFYGDFDEKTSDPHNQKKRTYVLILGKEQTETNLWAICMMAYQLCG